MEVDRSQCLGFRFVSFCFVLVQCGGLVGVFNNLNWGIKQISALKRSFGVFFFFLKREL